MLKNLVSKPTTCINNRTSDEKAYVVIVDEVRLLWIPGKHFYRRKSQLYDLLEESKAVVTVFDINQLLSTEQLLHLKHEANLKRKFYKIRKINEN